jgi:hypothetical protein
VLGGYQFSKTPIGSGYHKRLQLVLVGIRRTAQHLFGHFRVCVFVTLGLEICSQCGFLAMVVTALYGASSLEKGLVDLIGGREKFCFYVFLFAGSW